MNATVRGMFDGAASAQGHAGLATMDGAVAIAVVLDPSHRATTAYGHDRVVQAGAPVLREILEHLGHLDDVVVRSDLGWLIRISGESDPARFVYRLRDVLGPHLIELDGETCVVETSMGVAIGSDLPSVSSAVELDRYADAALATALQCRFRVTYADARMRDSVVGAVDLARRLKQSADSDFFVMYQPLVRLADRHIAGYESLLRWRTQDGIVTPDRFMSVAESTSMIVPLGRRTISQAIATLATRISPGLGTEAFVSINLSDQQLFDTTVTDYIGRLVAEYGVAPQQIWVEVRENEMIQLDTLASRTIERLHELGCRICIDDLGSGFSALSYVRDLPIDVLKVDRSLIGRLIDNGPDRALVRAICEVARATGIVTVAEGIEDADVLPHLTDLGFDLGQGYFFGRPGSSPDVFGGVA